jgi:3-oxoadipate enol-lactonase/4-carboxymuconolactone decarboxylase
MQFKAVGPNVFHVDARLASGRRSLVFINSLGSELGIWDQVAGDLGTHWGILRYDKRGHGLSSDVSANEIAIADHANDLALLLDEHGVKQAVICGLSAGGMIALDLADRRPDLVAGLVLADTAHRIGTAEIWNSRIQAIRNSGMDGIADAVMERWFTLQFRASRKAELHGYRAMVARCPAKGYAATCAAIRDADLTETARRIRVPTLCMTGDADAATPPDLVRELAALIPKARFEIISQAGHLPCIEQPAAMIRLIRAFLQDSGLAELPALDEDQMQAGIRTRRIVLGNAHVERSVANMTPFDQPFQRLITQMAWNSVWSRPGLTPRERSLLTIALLAALGHDEEVEMHVRATANTGASANDVAEALLHVAIYAGVPAANQAFKIAKKIYKDMEAIG